MANTNTMDGLYEDLEDPANEGQTVNLVDADLIDPDMADHTDDEYEDFQEDGEYDSDQGDYIEDDDEVDDKKDNPKASLVETNIINDLLKEKGILDPKAIKYENEDGDIEELDFYELPYEDQLQILKQQEQDDSNGLSDHENEVINFLREQNATLDDVLEYVKRSAIEDYERETSGKAFTVDEYDDEELFLIDLKLNFEDLTDDELKLQLSRELEHEELFKKKIAKIRAQYVDLELKERESAEINKKQQEEEEFETLSSTLIDAAVNLEDIGGLVLEDNDKNIILSTILESDANGKSSFDKKMIDPQMKFKAAWFVEKGDEAFELIHDYYKKEIDKVRKSSFEKGKASVSKTSAATPKASFVRTQKQTTNGKKFLSIDDLS